MWPLVIVLLVVALVAVLAGVFGLVFFFRGTKRTNQALQKIPVTRVAHALPDKMARVVGKLKAADGPLLRAPLSGKPCGYFQAVVEEWRSSGNSEGWVQLAHEEQWCDFSLDDGTGRVLVRMLRPQISADLEEAAFSDPVLPPTPAQEAFLRRHQVWHPTEGKPQPRLRYLESLFEVEEQITAYGMIHIDTDGKNVRVVIEAPPGQLLLVSDDKQITRVHSPMSAAMSVSAIR
jgi:hypothetical protein